MTIKLPEIDFTQPDEVLRELGSAAGRQARENLLSRRFKGQPQQGDEHLVRLQSDTLDEARKEEQAATALWNRGSEEQGLIAHGKHVWLSAYAIALRHEGVLNHSTRMGQSSDRTSSRSSSDNLLFKLFVRDWWRSVILLGSIGILGFLSGDGGATPILLIGIIWLAVELLIGFRRLRGRRPSRQVRGNNSDQVSANEGQAQVIGQWRPGFRFVLFTALYLALVVVTSGLALIPLLFLIYPLWATAQQTKGNIVDVEGEQVQVMYWIRRSRVWLITHKLTPRALAKMGRLTQMFVSVDGELFVYQRDFPFPPLFIFTPDPDAHDLRQFTGGSKNVTIDRLSAFWSRILGLAAPFGRIELIGPSKDRPLILEGVIDPKRVGDILTSFRPEPRPAIDETTLAAIAATVTSVLNNRNGGSGNGGNS